MAKYSKETQARADAKRAGRTRNFATVTYPESAPSDWQETLNQAHVAALISPLHDQDTNPSGEPKKPHYHVLVMYENVKDFEKQVKPLFDAIGGVGRESINSLRGYARYLCHLDNPEKHQYNPSDVKSFGGADYFEIISLPSDDRKELIELFAYIRRNSIYSISELLDISAIYHPQWFELITTRKAYIVDKYMKSLQWEKESDYSRKSYYSDKDGIAEKMSENDTHE